MPTIDPSVLARALTLDTDDNDDNDNDDAPPAYVATEDDRRRAKVRLGFAADVCAALEPHTPTLAAMRAALSDPSRETVGALRDVLEARTDASTPPLKLVRVLCIDADRLLAGAADRVPV